MTDGTFRFTSDEEEGQQQQQQQRRRRPLDGSHDPGAPDRFLGTAIDCLNQCYPHGRRARVLVFISGAPWGPGDERECWICWCWF